MNGTREAPLDDFFEIAIVFPGLGHLNIIYRNFQSDLPSVLGTG